MANNLANIIIFYLLCRNSGNFKLLESQEPVQSCVEIYSSLLFFSFSYICGLSPVTWRFWSLPCITQYNQHTRCDDTFIITSFVCVFLAPQPPLGQGLLIQEVSRSHTVGRTPMEEWSARHRDLYLTTHNTHNRQISMPPSGFEPTISAGERPQNYALDRTSIGTGIESFN